MGYKSRKRHIQSRREKYKKSTRNIKVFFLFLTIAIAVWVIKNRHEYWGWLKTQFY